MSLLVLPARSKSMLSPEVSQSDRSLAFGAASQKSDKAFRSLRDKLSRKLSETSSSGSDASQLTSLREALGVTLLTCKKMVSLVAMHLDDDWRRQLLSDLDRLLDFEDWENGFSLPSQDSFSTLLRAIVYLHPTKRPGFGLSQRGTFLSSWSDGKDRIVLEALGGDEIRWVLSRTLDGERETAAGTVQIHRVPEVIAPYNPDSFFENAL